MKKIFKLFIIIIFIIIVAFILIVLLNRKIEPLYISYANIEMKRVVNTVINKTVSEYEFNNDLFIVKNNNDLTIIDYDPIVINKIISYISNNVYDNLKLIEKMDATFLKKYNIDKSVFYIPTGVIFNVVVLNNLGPKIPVKLEPISSVNCNLETKVTEYGINNSLIEMSVKIEASFRMILPFSTNELNVVVTTPFAVKIIQGNIPEYYFGGLKNSS